MSHMDALILLAVGLSAILLWLLVPRSKSSGRVAHPLAGNGVEAFPQARHYHHFSQIRRALSAEDTDYLIRSAPPDVAQRALRERRAVARQFLAGLREDFSNLARFGRTLAALSPSVSRQQETERLFLSIKFQFLYALVWLRLSTGTLPIAELEHLTGLVGRLAMRMDEAMAQISALSAKPLTREMGV